MVGSVVRRLTVLQDPETEDARAEARPAWQWVLIGSTLTLLIFAPLSVLASWAGARLSAGYQARDGFGAAMHAAPVLAAFALAATSAGAFVGRFGRRANVWNVASTGALGGAALVVLAALGGALSPWIVALGVSIVLVASGAAFSLLGARFGRRARPGPTLGTPQRSEKSGPV